MKQFVTASIALFLIACAKDNNVASGPSTGALAVSSAPAGAAVVLDNVPTGRTTPATLQDLAAGAHTVKLTMASYADTTFTAMVAENDTTAASIAMRSIVATSADSLYVRISLAELPATLTFNQAHVPTNRGEYRWGILFDTDDDTTTGLLGYDIEIALAYYKRPGPSFEASPVEGTQHLVLEWFDSANVYRGYHRHSDVVARIDPADPNTLVMVAPREWAEIARIGESNRYRIWTTFVAPDPPIRSDQALGVGTQPTADPPGDVEPGFVDIVWGGWTTSATQAMGLFMSSRAPVTGANGAERRIPEITWSGRHWTAN